MNLSNLREEVLEANISLEDKKLVISTWGNVSGFDPERGIMLIKASGVPYQKMRSKHIVAVTLDGEIQGEYAPSTDWKTHLEIYKVFQNEGIRGIVHTHSKFATIWAQLGREIPNYGTTHSDYFRGNIPCTRPMTREEIEGDYEGNTGLVIAETFRDKNCRSLPAVLVNRHAPFCWGISPTEAVHHAEVLEYVAEMAIYDVLLSGGKCQEISPIIASKHYNRKFGPDAYYGQTVEL